MKTASKILLLIIILLTGCQNEPKDFTLVFTMESINSYKLSITINKDKSYIIQQQNLFFDAHANKEQINTSKGNLSEEEFAEIKKLISGSYIFKMKDSYGFDKDSDDAIFSSLIYQLSYTEGHKNKYISMRPNQTDLYSKKFLSLITFLSNYISSHIEDKSPIDIK